MLTRRMTFDLAGIVAPVVVSTLVLVVGGLLVRRYAGPVMQAQAQAQAAYNAALEGRVRVLQAERDEMRLAVDRLHDEVNEMQAKIADLERQVRDLERENIELHRRLESRAGRQS